MWRNRIPTSWKATNSIPPPTQSEVRYGDPRMASPRQTSQCSGKLRSILHAAQRSLLWRPKNGLIPGLIPPNISPMPRRASKVYCCNAVHSIARSTRLGVLMEPLVVVSVATFSLQRYEFASSIRSQVSHQHSVVTVSRRRYEAASSHSSRQHPIVHSTLSGSLATAFSIHHQRPLHSRRYEFI